MKKSNVYAVIMAGGAGTRLWPMSRTGKPKQMLKFIADPVAPGRAASLLQLSVGRLRGLIDPTCIYICTGAAFTQQILEDLPLLPAAQVLGEPVGRDTCAAVTLGAALVGARSTTARWSVASGWSGSARWAATRT